MPKDNGGVAAIIEVQLTEKPSFSAHRAAEPRKPRLALELGGADGGEDVGIGGAEEAEGFCLVVGDAAFAVDDDDAACRAAGQPAFHSIEFRDLSVGVG